MRAVDVLVVGAGAAGVAAALEARRGGAEVLLVDEHGQAGGWLRWSVAELPERAGQRGYELASALADDLNAAGVAITHGTAWGLFEERVVGVVSAGASFQALPAAVIIASGATDIVAPFPGWELPGVMTATAVLRALHEWRVLPMRRVAVVGSGAEAREATEALKLAGAEIVAAADAVSGAHAGGDGRVEWFELAGTRSVLDGVVLALGRQPDAELAFQALCEQGFARLDGAFVPLRGPNLETSVPGVYVVGDAAGCCSVSEALAEGRVAGRAATGGDSTEAVAALARLRGAERADAVAALRLPAGMSS